jgi:hypothetical protein
MSVENSAGGPAIKAEDSAIFQAGVDKLFVPVDVKQYYLYAEWFYSNTAIGAVINKMARFPLSDIKVRSKNPETERRGKKTIRRMKMVQKLIKYGRNYFLYGLGIIVPMQPINKILVCKTCGKRYRLADLEKNGKPLYQYSNGKFYFKCRSTKCKQRGATKIFSVEDQRIKDVDKLNLAIWDPNLITCTHNEITDTKQWKYTVGKEMQNKISNKDHYILSTTPQIYLDAVQNNQSIRVHDDRIFVMEAPTLTINGKPVPPMVMAFQELLLRDKYNRANRSVANNLLISLRMLFPIHKNESGARPLTETLRLRDWRSVIQSELAKWEKDNSHVVILPVEIGTKDVWGNGKLLALHNELRANMADIMSVMDVPIEFMYGGATWSRQNTSAIMLENTFKQYAAQLQDIFDNVSEYINKFNTSESDNIEIALTVPRLVEALSELTFIERRYEAGEVSPQTYYDKLSMDARREFARIEATKISREAAALSDARRKAMAQAEAEDVLMKSRIKTREFERVEGLKDNLANIAVKKDDSLADIEVKKELSNLDMEVQKNMMLTNKKIQDLQMRDQVQQNLEVMRESLKLQSKAEYQNAKKMQKLQLRGMKDMARTEEEIAAESAQRHQEQMLIGIYESLLPEEKAEIDALPLEERKDAIMEIYNKKKMAELIENLPPEEKEEFENMNEQERELKIEELMNEESEEQIIQGQIENDDKLKKELVSKEIEERKEQENLLNQAKVYNQLYGEDKEKYKHEIIQESSEKFAKVKQLADYLKTYQYVQEIMNADPQKAKKIYENIKITDPELQDDVAQAIEDQLMLQQQAQAYAMKLVHTIGTEEQEKLINDLTENSPGEFRQMVFNNYEQFINMNRDKQKLPRLTKKNREDRMIAEMKEKINSYPEEMKTEIMNALAYENKELYNRIKMEE